MTIICYQIWEEQFLLGPDSHIKNTATIISCRLHSHASSAAAATTDSAFVVSHSIEYLMDCSFQMEV
jgi:hypothetical protein